MFTKLGNQWVRHKDFDVKILTMDFLLYQEGDYVLKLDWERTLYPSKIIIYISQVKNWGEKHVNESISEEKLLAIKANVNDALAVLEITCVFE